MQSDDRITQPGATARIMALAAMRQAPVGYAESPTGLHLTRKELCIRHGRFLSFMVMRARNTYSVLSLLCWFGIKHTRYTFFLLAKDRKRSCRKYLSNDDASPLRSVKNSGCLVSMNMPPTRSRPIFKYVVTDIVLSNTSETSEAGSKHSQDRWTL